MYIISHSTLSVRVFSVLPWIYLLLGTSCQISPPHVLPIVSKSLFSLCNKNPLPTFWFRTSSFTQNRRTEYHYPIPFPCRFLINNLESNSYEVCILFLFLHKRMSSNIQSVQNVLTYTGRAPHWAPEILWYSTSSLGYLYSLFIINLFRVPCFGLCQC